MAGPPILHVTVLQARISTSLDEVHENRVHIIHMRLEAMWQLAAARPTDGRSAAPAQHAGTLTR